MIFGMSRPPEIVLAETVPLTPRQQAFWLSSKGYLDFALPLDLWLDHRYSVAPTQRGRPLAEDGRERWYGYAQVVERGVNPRSRRHVPIVTAASMSTIRRKRS